MAVQERETQTRDNYRWVALTNTTAAVFMSALDGSIVIISLPAIFRGIHLDPLAPGQHRLSAVDDHGLPAGPVGAGRHARSHRRHVRPRQGLQLRVHRLHGRVNPVVVRPIRRLGGRSVAHRLAAAAGGRGIDADGEFGGDPDRRVPARPAWLRARLQPGGRAGRSVHRPGGRWTAGRVGLAGGVLGERARRGVRHHLGLPAPARQR